MRLTTMPRVAKPRGQVLWGLAATAPREQIEQATHIARAADVGEWASESDDLANLVWQPLGEFARIDPAETPPDDGHLALVPVVKQSDPLHQAVAHSGSRTEVAPL